MATMNLIIKSYPPEASALVEIFKSYEKSSLNEIMFNYITFENKRPKNPKTQHRRIAGLKAESICYLKDDQELLKMSVENFIYLMAKCGVDFEIMESKGD